MLKIELEGNDLTNDNIEKQTRHTHKTTKPPPTKILSCNYKLTSFVLMMDTNTR